MSNFLIFFALSLVVWGALIYKAWQMNDDEKAEVSAKVQTVTQQSAARLQSLTLRSDPTPVVDAQFATSFRAWINDAALIPEDLHRWATGLPDEHFEVITEFVAQFCSDMGFDLQGVINGTYTDRDLDDTLERVIIHMMTSTQLIFGVREELLAHETVTATQPELANQLQSLMESSKASVNGVLNRSGLTGGANGHLNGHSN
ncbi:MAG: hypothetical protein ACPG8W_00220 [Candidatus Promineifilaceae bacterium]